MKYVGTTPGGTKVYQMTLDEWEAFQRGPDGTCQGCYEPNAYCQCEKEEQCPDPIPNTP